ncbi:MAG: FUN14 domain-containing protein [Candidatus Nitrosopolaris sp.]
MAMPEIMPLVSTMGGGFLAGALIGYALKKVMKIAGVIVGVFIAVLAYLQYQRIIQVDWDKLQAVSQSGITTIVNAVTHISNNIGATHTGALSNVGIPLASSASAGFALGLVRG